MYRWTVLVVLSVHSHRSCYRGCVGAELCCLIDISTGSTSWLIHSRVMIPEQESASWYNAYVAELCVCYLCVCAPVQSSQYMCQQKEKGTSLSQSLFQSFFQHRFFFLNEGLIILTLLAMPFGAIWINTEHIMLLFGQNAQVSRWHA